MESLSRARSGVSAEAILYRLVTVCVTATFGADFGIFIVAGERWEGNPEGGDDDDEAYPGCVLRYKSR